MKHVYFTTPFEWRELKKLKERDRITLWLMAIPISEQEYRFLEVQEYRFLEERGEDAFETLLEANDAEYYNPRRNSLI